MSFKWLKIATRQDANQHLLNKNALSFSFDWKIFEKSNLHHKIVLSGGINIKNVDNAICIQPWCIDINSGVESSVGIKDISLVKDILKKF